MNAPKAVILYTIFNGTYRSREFMLGVLLVVAACVGCGSSRLDADAREYVRIESKVAASMNKADQLKAKGDQKGYLDETMNGTAISMEMTKIRKRYEDASEERTAEFMQAVERVKAAMR